MKPSRPRHRYLLASLLALTSLTTGCSATGTGTENPSTSAGVEIAPTASDPSTSRCSENFPGVNLRVDNAQDLEQALETVKPGQRISLANGRYDGNFVVATQASEAAPIQMCGDAAAILAGGASGYTLHLQSANWWHLEGFTVSGGEKGVMVDNTQHTTLRGLKVTGTGHEAVHLRTASSDNVLSGLQISTTGLTRPEFGEGIYIGTAEDNWCRYTNCEPDKSDRNIIVSVTFGFGITAENIDVKEGTSRGLITNNQFNGAGAIAADSWIDVKGNGWVIAGNRGESTPKDGMQVHVVEPGWGQQNTFANNDLTVNAPGYGIWVGERAQGTIVSCDNTAVGAAAGLTNTDCV